MSHVFWQTTIEPIRLIEKRHECAGESLELVACEEPSEAVKAHRVNRIVVAMRDRPKLPVELLLSLKSPGVLIHDGTSAKLSVEEGGGTC